MEAEKIIEIQEELIRLQQNYIQMTAGNKGSEQEGEIRKSKTSNGPTFGECAEYYLNGHGSVMRPSSLASSKWLLSKYILPEFGHVSVSDLDSQRLQEYANALLDRLKLKSVKDLIAQIKTILNYCTEDGKIEHKTVKVRYPKEESEDYRILSKEEYETLKGYCEKEENPINTAILIALETGARIGEVCAITWGDVDLQNRKISIKGTVQRIYDAEKKISYRILGKTKTESGRRDVPLTDSLYRVLSNQMGDSAIYVATGRETYTEPRTLRQAYVRRLKKLGIAPLTFHALRHSYITRAIERGVDPKTLSKLVGHSNCKITLERYTSVTEDMMRQAIRLLS